MRKPFRGFFFLLLGRFFGLIAADGRARAAGAGRRCDGSTHNERERENEIHLVDEAIALL